jgi:hypothetical protein
MKDRGDMWQSHRRTCGIHTYVEVTHGIHMKWHSRRTCGRLSSGHMVEQWTLGRSSKGNVAWQRHDVEYELAGQMESGSPVGR